MKIYLAPMEGVTSVTYRTVYKRHFQGVDLFFTPFMVATHTHSFQGRERRETEPFQADTVPQLMTKDASVLLPALLQMAQLGYERVDLNLGCPAPTAVTKGRGSGMLKDPDALDRFFDTVFSHMLSREKMHSFLEEQRASDPYFPNYADAAFAFLNSEELRLPDLSVKTRVGLSSHIETPALAKVLARYPFREIIVHPRVREEYYSGEPNWDSYQCIKESVSVPMCYNGDLRTVEDVERLLDRFPDTDRIMLGRGILADPSLPRQIHKWVQEKDAMHTGNVALPSYRNTSLSDASLSDVSRMNPSLSDASLSEASLPDVSRSNPFRSDAFLPDVSLPDSSLPELSAGSLSSGKMSLQELTFFLEDLKDSYRQVLSGDRDTLFKLIDVWSYLGTQFPGHDKELKAIRRSKTLKEYEAGVAGILPFFCPEQSSSGLR